MIDLCLEDYCDGCPDMEPVAVNHYADCQVTQTEIRCVNAARCRNIAEHIKQKDQGRRMP